MANLIARERLGAAAAQSHVIPYTGADREAMRRRDEAWHDLRVLAEARDAEKFPWELYVVTALLALLYVVGCCVPLMQLGAPSNGTQAITVVSTALLVLFLSGFMLFRAQMTFGQWKKASLSPKVRMQMQHEQAQEEGWAAQDAAEAALRGK